MTHIKGNLDTDMHIDRTFVKMKHSLKGRRKGTPHTTSKPPESKREALNVILPHILQKKPSLFGTLVSNF
jgi:hypothetical protein